MSFHRLVSPTYIGGLPAGYDLLNAGGAIVDPEVVSGLTSPTYFVVFGEDGRSGAVNRGHSALAQNTDIIDDFLHGDQAVLTSQDFAASTAAILTATATVPVFVGPPGTANTQAGLEPYFHVTDQQNNDIVDVSSNVQVVVTGASTGVGTFSVSNVTLTLNITPSIPYRVWFGKRSSLVEMTRDGFVRSNIWSIERTPASLTQYKNNISSVAAGKGAELVGLNTTGFTSATQSLVTGGGIGTTPTTVKAALQAINDRLVQRRSFTAVITDGTLSVGGDYNTPILDQAINDLTEGTFFLRRGSYTIGNTVASSLAANFEFYGEATVVGILLASTRTSDLVLQGSTKIRSVVLGSLSTLKRRFVYTPSGEGCYFLYGQSVLIAGSLLSTGGAGGVMELEDILTVSPFGSSNAALEVSGEVKLRMRRCVLGVANGTPLRNCYLHDFTNPLISSIVVEESTFTATDVNVHGIELDNIFVPTVFRNCTFNLTATSGTGYALFIDTCISMVFENCEFITANGQLIWADNAGVSFKNCRGVSLDTTPGAATSQMIMISGSPASMVEIECFDVVIGATSVQGLSASIQLAVVELGGKNNTPTQNVQMRVDGLTISYSISVPSSHNFSTVLLHGGNSSGEIGAFRNVYKNVTLNCSAVPVDNTGTLGSAYPHLSTHTPMFVEIGGADVRTACVVENLRILDVRNPSTNHARGVLFAQKALLRSVEIDGSTTTGAAAYTDYLANFDQCTVRDLVICRTQGLAASGLGQVLLTGNSRWVGGEYNARTSTIPSFAWILLGDTNCGIQGINGYWSSATAASTAVCVSMPHESASLIDCQLYVDGSFAAQMISAGASSTAAIITNNRLFWKRGIAQILVSTGVCSNVLGNQLLSSVGVPTYVVSGTSSSDNNNIAAQITPALPVPV